MAAAVPVITPCAASIGAGTPIEIRVDADDSTQIFFTIDGSKPEPFVRHGGGATLAYQGRPFTLEPGRRVVRAIGVLRDNPAAAPSAMCTRYYDVVDERTAGSGAGSLPAPAPPRTGSTRSLPRDGPAELGRSVGGHHSRSPLPADDCQACAGRAGRLQHQHLGTCPFCPPSTAWALPPAPAPAPTASPLVCHVCSASRHGLDPLAACGFCGTQPARAVTPSRRRQASGEPRHRHRRHRRRSVSSSSSSASASDSEEAPEQLLATRHRCPFCTTPLKPAARFCFACENKIPIPSDPALAATAVTLTTCHECKAANPRSLTHCATCDTRLHHSQAPATATAAPAAAGGELVVPCHNCTKHNPVSARFCNWCGFKAPLPVQEIVVCPACALENMAGARYCNDCGMALPTQPPRARPASGLMGRYEDLPRDASGRLVSLSASAQPDDAPDTPRRPGKSRKSCDAETQTTVCLEEEEQGEREAAGRMTKDGEALALRPWLC
mgnify:CR=1 FL=1